MCDRKWYYIYEQDHVTASDLRSGMPKLQERIVGMEKSNVIDVPEVVASGGLSANGIVGRLEKACAAKGKTRSEGCRSLRTRRHGSAQLTFWVLVYPEREENAYKVVVTTPPALPSEAKARTEVLAGTGKHTC